MESFEDYVNHMINEGYIAKNGTPLKCFHCDSKDMETYEEYYEEHLRVEFSVRCKECKEHVSTWSYGNWNL